MKGVSIPELWSMFFSIETHGKVRKHIPTKDRLGMTNPPLLSSTNVDYLPVLHVMLRTFDWSLKVVYHRRAGLSTWTEKAEDHEILKVVKNKVQACLQKKLVLGLTSQTQQVLVVILILETLLEEYFGIKKTEIFLQSVHLKRIRKH